jgi:K+ transporter
MTRSTNPGLVSMITLLVLLGAGMLYGDGVITTRDLSPVGGRGRRHGNEGLVRVAAHYGFTQAPRITQILALGKQQAEPGVFSDPIYFFLARPRVVPARGADAMPNWRPTLYAIMLRNATPLTDSLGLPAHRIVEFGVAIPV